jgi:3-carboxy-cis,cis-muconate cycloisomerase
MTAQLHSLLWQDEEIGRLFSPQAEIVAMLAFEAALANAQAHCDLISKDAAQSITSLCAIFTPDMELLEQGIRRDGMAVPELIRQLRGKLPNQFREALHLRSTSQDVIDTALMMRLRDVLKIFEERLRRTVAQLDDLERRDGKIPQMGRTRMQRALPLTAADRISAWRAPLIRHQERLTELRPRLLVVQCGGPVGIDHGPWLPDLAKALGLGVPSRSWHTARDGLAELASWISLVSGSLGKIGQDIAMMSQNEISEAVLVGGGKSSVMHHKSNPVQAELLVALARFNAVQLSGLHQALVHEQERSGSAWALEWMILPRMISACGASMAHSIYMLNSLTLKSGP